jgi:hypothetical protein
MLVEYVLGEHGRRVGVVVALDSHSIGWSKIRESNYYKGRYVNIDTFDKKRALQIAVGRAMLSTSRSLKKAPSKEVQRIVEKMKQRAVAYYKEQTMEMVL